MLIINLIVLVLLLRMSRFRRSNLSQQSRNAIRFRNIVNHSTEEEREIARDDRRFSMARLRAFRTQEQKEAARQTFRLEKKNRQAQIISILR